MGETAMLPFYAAAGLCIFLLLRLPCRRLGPGRRALATAGIIVLAAALAVPATHACALLLVWILLSLPL